MAILVLNRPLPAQPFAQALRAIAGDTPVWTEEDDFDPARVEAVLAWRPKPGILPRYPKLRVLCSTGAGVEVLAGRNGLPALLARSDILVNALPLTDDTRALLDRTRLSQLPQPRAVDRAAGY